MATPTIKELTLILKRYTPFDKISEHLLDLLAKDLDIRAAAEGSTLFEHGDFDPDEYYLLTGRVALIARDGRKNIIEAGQSNANYPLARLRPRMYTAKADSAIKYFVISSSVLDELQRSIQSDDGKLIVQEMKHKAGEEGEALLYEFKQELNAGRFVLPTLPEVAFKIRELMETQDFSMGELAKLVNTDPAIAIKLIRVANSALYRGVSHCDDTQAAIARLGLITTKQLVTSFAVLGIFKTKSHMFKEHMRLLWQESVEVAAYSYVLAKELPRFNEEEALLAGLIHRIGEIVVLTYAERYYDLSSNEKNLSVLTALLRGKAGAMVLRKWDFSKDLITVAEESNNWLREHADPFDYCDLVQVAILYATMEGSQRAASPEISSVPAFKKLAERNFSTEQIAEVIAEAQQQIDEIKLIFSDNSAD